MADRVGQQLGHYRLLRVLGQGAFAEVYLAEHLYLERPAAIKILHVQMRPETQERFRREARTIAHLQHPHIVQVLDFGLDGQTPYLVMEYTPGGALQSHHLKGTPLPLEQIVTYVKQIASALDYAHRQRIIHRDVKPENLLLNARHEILLSDFGIAVVQHTLDSLSTQAPAGTPLYMAPEQIQRRPCAASDQYALGVLVYEWLTGQLPFRGTLYEVFSQHLTQPPPSLRAAIPGLPVAVEDVVFKALAKAPEQRFACVEDFASMLEDASLTAQPGSFYGPRSGGMTPYEVSETEIASDDLTAALPPSAASLQAPPTHYGSPPYGIPTQTQYESLHAYDVPPQATPPPPLRRLSVGLITLLIGIVFLLLAGSGGIYYAAVFRPNHLPVQASSTVEAQRTATAHAQQATATSQAQQTTVTALANTPQSLYNSATSGSPVLEDPLSHTDDNTWDESHTATYSCTFSGGTYHASLNSAKNTVICAAYATTFRNMAYQVQMTLIKGDRAGILFRFASDKFSGYRFSLASDGTYELSLLQGSSKLSVLRSGSSSFIKTGLNQSNLLAIIASGSNIYLYVNKQFVTSVSDTTFSSGQIGVQASEDSLPTEAVFQNAQVWNL